MKVEHVLVSYFRRNYPNAEVMREAVDKAAHNLAVWEAHAVAETASHIAKLRSDLRIMRSVLSELESSERGEVA